MTDLSNIQYYPLDMMSWYPDDRIFPPCMDGNKYIESVWFEAVDFLRDRGCCVKQILMRPIRHSDGLNVYCMYVIYEIDGKVCYDYYLPRYRDVGVIWSPEVEIECEDFKVRMSKNMITGRRYGDVWDSRLVRGKWIGGDGVINWSEVMRRIRAEERDRFREQPRWSWYESDDDADMRDAYNDDYDLWSSR